MNRERKLLLTILSVALVIPLTLALILNFRKINNNKELMEAYTITLSESKSETSEILILDSERKRLAARAELARGEFFSSETFGYYDFVELITASGENRDIIINDYQTLTSPTAPALSVTAVGSSVALLSYLFFLESFGKQIPFRNLTINRREDKEAYRMNCTVLYLTSNTSNSENE